MFFNPIISGSNQSHTNFIYSSINYFKKYLIFFISLFILTNTISLHARSMQKRLLDKSARKAALKELWDQGNNAETELKEMLRSSDRELKMTALVRIVNLKSSDYSVEAVNILNDSGDFEIRKTALQYLCLIKEKSIFSKLKEMAANGNTDERYYAIKAAGYIFNSDDVEFNEAETILVNELKNETDEKMKIEIAFELAKMGSDKGYETAVSLIQSNNPIIREIAVETLGEIGNSSALTYIENALNDNEVWVRTKAKVAKEKLELTADVMPQGRKVSMRKMKRETKSNKISKLRNIINSDKTLEIKIWAANELLNMGEEGRSTADEIISNNEKGSYVLVKERNNRMGK